jgi:hypothetical protein
MSLLSAHLCPDSCYFFLLLCIYILLICTPHSYQQAPTIDVADFGQETIFTSVENNRKIMWQYCILLIFSYISNFYNTPITYFHSERTPRKTKKISKYLKQNNSKRFLGTLIVGAELVTFHEVNTSGCDELSWSDKYNPPTLLH